MDVLSRDLVDIAALAGLDSVIALKARSFLS
jgi:hypothetical protein